MAFAENLRFRVLMDLAKFVIFTVDGFRSYLARLAVKSPTSAPNQQQQSGGPVRIPSSGRTLNGCFIQPHLAPTATLLILHGIGDRLRYWRLAQHHLAQHGVASLVFHYSGYPGSDGATTVANLHQDVHAAYAWLQNRATSPIFLLGFSMGTGVAGNAAASVSPPPAGVILCEAFPSLRQAARCVVRPAVFLARLLPDVWRTHEQLAHLPVPLLIVHTTGDTLFPVAMAEELHRCAPPSAQLVVLKGHRHNALFASVPADYWAVILDFMQRTIAVRAS